MPREREPAINVENLDISQEFAKQRWKQPTTIGEEDRGKETPRQQKKKKSEHAFGLRREGINSVDDKCINAKIGRGEFEFASRFRGNV